MHAVSAQGPPKDNTNKFRKVVPVIKAARNMRVSVSLLREYCSVDEQMIPFTGRMPAKPVIKSQSNPVGIKSWVPCGK